MHPARRASSASASRLVRVRARHRRPPVCTWSASAATARSPGRRPFRRERTDEHDRRTVVEPERRPARHGASASSAGVNVLGRHAVGDDADVLRTHADPLDELASVVLRQRHDEPGPRDPRSHPQPSAARRRPEARVADLAVDERSRRPPPAMAHAGPCSPVGDRDVDLGHPGRGGPATRRGRGRRVRGPPTSRPDPPVPRPSAMVSTSVAPGAQRLAEVVREHLRAAAVGIGDDLEDVHPGVIMPWLGGLGSDPSRRRLPGGQWLVANEGQRVADSRASGRPDTWARFAGGGPAAVALPWGPAPRVLDALFVAGTYLVLFLARFEFDRPRGTGRSSGRSFRSPSWSRSSPTGSGAHMAARGSTRASTTRAARARGHVERRGPARDLRPQNPHVPSLVLIIGPVVIMVLEGLVRFQSRLFAFRRHVVGGVAACASPSSARDTPARRRSARCSEPADRPRARGRRRRRPGALRNRSIHGVPIAGCDRRPRRDRRRARHPPGAARDPVGADGRRARRRRRRGDARPGAGPAASRRLGRTACRAARHARPQHRGPARPPSRSSSTSTRCASCSTASVCSSPAAADRSAPRSPARSPSSTPSGSCCSTTTRPTSTTSCRRLAGPRRAGARRHPRPVRRRRRCSAATDPRSCSTPPRTSTCRSSSGTRARRSAPTCSAPSTWSRPRARVDVSHFVCISTDKAATPSSVMGASKWIAEQIVLDAAPNANYRAVRFGNVLGQPRQRDPDVPAPDRRRRPGHGHRPRMTRYFMSTDEAVRLVLHAAALDDGPPGARARDGRAGQHLRARRDA